MCGAIYRFKRFGHGEGIVKLFIGGLHGEECEQTRPILERLARECAASHLSFFGDAVILPCLVERGRHVSVLREEYYRMEAGRRLLSLVRFLHPRFYFEIHSYGMHSLSRLTSAKRFEIEGVPPFVELERGILIGSISPILRKEFRKDAFCLTVEIPKWHCDAVEERVLVILRACLAAESRDALLKALRRMYPEQMRKAEELFRMFYTEIEPF